LETLKPKYTVSPGATVGVTKSLMMLFAYLGSPGVGTSAMAAAENSSKEAPRRATTGFTGFILCWEAVARLYGFRYRGRGTLARVIRHLWHRRDVLGARVDRERAEALRKSLASAGLVDRSRHIADDGTKVVIPLLSEPEKGLLEAHGAALVDQAFAPRRARQDPIEEVTAKAQVPEELRQLLPDKWELIGDVLVLRLDARLDGHETAVARAYADVLNAKAVLRDIGGISGEYREPVLRRVLGNDTVTVHKENGILYKLDAARVMFSSGNIEERVRMSEVQCDGETVVDMFAGIGYFSLPLAVHQRPREVVACEANSVAHGYLVENTRLNGVEGKIKPVLGDNRSLPGEDSADRVVMGYVKTTHEFLPTAYRLLRSGGVVHYHETCPNELLPDRPVHRLREALPGGKVNILRLKEIKSYAPGVSHVVVDARILKPS